MFSGGRVDAVNPTQTKVRVFEHFPLIAKNSVGAGGRTPSFFPVKT
jgi:hypothetical protein